MSPSLFVFSFAFVLALFMACGGPRTKYMNLLDNMGWWGGVCTWAEYAIAIGAIPVIGKG